MQRNESFLDPICQIVAPSDSPHNQWSRLCASALGSLYFRMKIRYPQPATNGNPCHRLEVSFRTEQARKELRNISEKYYEWMTPCKARDVYTDKEVYFFISRAYVSNQVFIYDVGDSFGTVYLENLSTHISVIDPEDVMLKTNNLRRSCRF